MSSRASRYAAGAAPPVDTGVEDDIDDVPVVVAATSTVTSPVDESLGTTPRISPFTELDSFAHAQRLPVASLGSVLAPRRQFVCLQTHQRTRELCSHPECVLAMYTCPRCHGQRARCEGPGCGEFRCKNDRCSAHRAEAARFTRCARCAYTYYCKSCAAKCVIKCAKCETLGCAKCMNWRALVYPGFSAQVCGPCVRLHNMQLHSTPTGQWFVDLSQQPAPPFYDPDECRTPEKHQGLLAFWQCQKCMRYRCSECSPVYGCRSLESREFYCRSCVERSPASANDPNPRVVGNLRIVGSI
jgi:hypothetical protein